MAVDLVQIVENVDNTQESENEHAGVHDLIQNDKIWTKFEKEKNEIDAIFYGFERNNIFSSIIFVKFKF